MHVIDFAQLVPVRPPEWGGAVVVQVRPCTVEQFMATDSMPLVTSVRAELERQRAFLTEHVRGIAGLAVRGEGGVERPVATVAEAFAQLPPSAIRVLILSVIRASSLTAGALGNSEPRSSGAGSTAGETAELADDED